MPKPIRKIGVLTGGGDAPGLNAVIRAVVKAACNAGLEVIGIEDSFDGLLEFNRSRVLTPRDVTGILRRGGTILGTVNTGDPFVRRITTSEGVEQQYADRVVEMYHRMGLGGLVVIGGDGTLGLAHRFTLLGLPIVGVPKPSTTTSSGRPTASGSTPPSRLPPMRSTGCTRRPRRTGTSARGRDTAWWRSIRRIS
jgi:ATP-dependent phosphofructokinase / diphosphate-dependent phosphofructokinase